MANSQIGATQLQAAQGGAQVRWPLRLDVDGAIRDRV
jgi:hypothetical protein